MKLSDYMALQGIDDAAFAALVGMERSNVSRLRRGLIRPTWKNAVIIADATKGAVTLADFAPGLEEARAPHSAEAAE